MGTYIESKVRPLKTPHPCGVDWFPFHPASLSKEIIEKPGGAVAQPTHADAVGSQ